MSAALNVQRTLMVCLSTLAWTGVVQFLQYYYQSGCLYRLRALGERHNMDLTVGECCAITRAESATTSPRVNICKPSFALLGTSCFPQE